MIATNSRSLPFSTPEARHERHWKCKQAIVNCRWSSVAILRPSPRYYNDCTVPNWIPGTHVHINIQFVNISFLKNGNVIEKFPFEWIYCRNVDRLAEKRTGTVNFVSGVILIGKRCGAMACLVKFEKFSSRFREAPVGWVLGDFMVATCAKLLQDFPC